MELRTCPTPPSRVCSARRAKTATSCCSVSRRPVSPTIVMSIDISGVVGMAGGSLHEGAAGMGDRVRGPAAGRTGAAQTSLGGWSHRSRAAVNCDACVMSYSTADSLRPVTRDDVRGAQKVLSGVARVTSMEGSRHLSRLVGAPVHFKCENLQRTGSFKLRGAYVRIAGLLPEERAAGVVAASAGNHAQGVALASSLLGVRSTVFMPTGAPLPKVAATRDYGAEVRLHGQVVDETLAAAQEYAAETGAVFIHPFDHPDIIAGQGTVGLEILEQCPEVRTIVVGIGGGGLAAGVAGAGEAPRPGGRGGGGQAQGAAADPPPLAGRPAGAIERAGAMAARPQ